MPRLNLIDRASRLGTAKLLLGGGGRVWTLVTLVSFMFRFVRWLGSRGVDTIREELRPGETLLIEHSRDPLGTRPTSERI